MALLPDMDDLREAPRKTENINKTPKSRKTSVSFDRLFFLIILSVPTIIGVSALFYGRFGLGLFLLSPWIVVYFLTTD
jgi:hypothetical protein